jgi:hypothetical protein
MEMRSEPGKERSEAMASHLDAGDSGRLAEFTTDLLRLRIERIRPGPIEYAVPGREVVTRREFEEWCAQADSKLKIGVRMGGRDTVKVRARIAEGSEGSSGSGQLSGEDNLQADGKREDVRVLTSRSAVEGDAKAAFRESFRKHVDTRGLESVLFVVEGGEVKLDGSQFFRWLELYDMAEFGWIGGQWHHETEDPRRRWVFVITNRTEHLLRKNLSPKKPHLAVRWFLSVLGPILTRWVPRGRHTRKREA